MAAVAIEPSGASLTEQLAVVHAALAQVPLSEYARQTPAEARRVAAQVRALESMLRTHAGAAVRAVERLVPVRDTRQLLAGDFGLDTGAAHRELRQARSLAKAPVAEQAAATGDISHAHAAVIGQAIGALPQDTTPAQREQAEQVLIADAHRLSPKDLQTRARRVTELWQTPEQTDATENQQLERREAVAYRNASLTMWDNRDGTWAGRFVLPELQARMLKTAIDALAAPRRSHLRAADASQGTASTDPGPSSTGTPDRVHRARAEELLRRELEKSYDRKAGEALIALVEHLPTDGFPTTGGTPAHIMVTIDEARLRSEVAAAALSTGERISAGELRRLACGHGILPAVLGGASIPIDLGRDQRLFTRRQRDALAVMDGGCVAPGCDRPPAWCEAHHGGVPFSEGGRTDLDEGYLLCSSHHHEAHQHRWRLRRTSRGVPEVDRGHGWERNHRYRP